MAIISDATSLILLAKIRLLNIFTERNKIIIPEKVYEEVIKGKEKGREDSMVVELLVEEKKLDIQKPDVRIKNNIEKLLNLKEGELEVVSLAYKTKHTILTDDKKCLNAAKSLNIKFITSLDAVTVLYLKKLINKKKTLENIDKLEEYGWYSKNLIKTYRGKIK